jgi:hypothetical protein
MSDNNLSARVGERIFAGAIGLVFAGQFMMALRYPPDPQLFPLIVAAAGFILAGLLVLGVGLHDHAIGAPEPVPRDKLVLTLAVSPVYGAALWILGYWIATIITVPAIAWLLGYRNKTILAAVTIGVALALGVLFPLLGVYLPVGLLPELVGL